MTIETVTKDYSSQVQYIVKSYNEKNPNFSFSIYKDTDPTNCKLDYIHGTGMLACLEDAQKKEVIETILKDSKGYIILNTTNNEVADFIKNNFQIYYSNPIPVGYGNRVQYNIAFRNHIKPNFSCKEPKAKNIQDIESKLRALLKSKRRKDDYVEEFIRSL